MKALNNSKIVEKTREYGVITEWEVRHQCAGDVSDVFTQKDIDENIPILCMLCQQDIVVFDQ